MGILTAIPDIAGILRRTFVPLLAGIPSDMGRQGAALRRDMGDLLARLPAVIRSDKFSQMLSDVFVSAKSAGVTLAYFDRALTVLFAEVDIMTQTLLAEQETDVGVRAVVHTCILFTLVQEAHIVTEQTFVSRDDIDTMQTRMRKWFEQARELAADEMDSACYLALLQLSAALSRYLADTGRPLPRMVDYTLPAPLPALAMSQLIYCEGSRWEEIVAENKVVHPAFVRREIRALSA